MSEFNYSKFVVLLLLWCLLLMAMLFTVVQLLLEVMAMHKVIAGIHVASATSMEMLMKSFAEGSIHAELVTMLRNSITNTVLVGHSWGNVKDLKATLLHYIHTLYSMNVVEPV